MCITELFPAPLGPNSPRTSPGDRELCLNLLQTPPPSEQIKNTFLDAERNVLRGHFPGLVQGEAFSFAFVLLPQVAHHHHWFLNITDMFTSYINTRGSVCGDKLRLTSSQELQLSASFTRAFSI